MSEICQCGHPRTVHEHLSDLYPAICSHVDAHATDADAETIREGVCLCLDYASEDHFTPHRAPETAPGPGANRTDHPTTKEHPHGQQGHEAPRAQAVEPRQLPPGHQAGPEGSGRAQRASRQEVADFNPSPAAQNTTHGPSEARDTPPAVARPATPAHQTPPAGARATRDGRAT